MSGALQSPDALTAPRAAGQSPATPARAAQAQPALARRVAIRLTNDYLPLAAWTVSRTGRSGLAGIALLAAAALFFVSTHLKVAAEVESMRDELAAAQGRARTTAAAGKPAGPKSGMPALPARSEMPSILRQIFNKATQARLALNTGRYEMGAAGGSIVRYEIALPVTGTYPQIRTFIDATLACIPSVAISDLVLDRKAIGDTAVEAQIKMTVFTSAAVSEPVREQPPPASIAANASPADRVVSPRHALALFAPHSWFVAPKPLPLPVAPPPPEPTAPPFPYTFIGSFSPEGQPDVFFLSHGDKVIDAHVGDRIDGVYQFESAGGGQLVFTYLPLQVRQVIPAGAPQ